MRDTWSVNYHLIPTPLTQLLNIYNDIQLQNYPNYINTERNKKKMNIGNSIKTLKNYCEIKIYLFDHISLLDMQRFTDDFQF